LSGWAILHLTRAGIIPTAAAFVISAILYFGGAVLFKNPALNALIDIGKSTYIRNNAAKEKGNMP
ncbi:MAG: hypothetical protein ACREHG_01690, partial [Candidatus Saccharimonadales bacterium]